MIEVALPSPLAVDDPTPHDIAVLAGLLRDRWWRLNNLYWIRDKWGKRVLFQPNAVQAKLDDELHFLNIVLKSRQHGVTTWAIIRALDMILFQPDVMTGVVAHTAGDARKFFRQKLLYAYDQLPTWLKKIRPAVRRDMNEGILEVAHLAPGGKVIGTSSTEVSVSHRGGTLQFLHISEYGPMCAKFPLAANEVATGALNTIARGNIVVIESTAHGATGDYYDRCKTAMDLDAQLRAGNGVLTDMDYRFHFYGWFDDPKSTMDPTHVPISGEMREYFDKIEDLLEVVLTAGQRAWYVKKSIEQGDDMQREYPSTPTEAFAASTEGTYYGKQMTLADKEGRIGAWPHNPSKPVHTFWDIGRRDATAIWFMQEDQAHYNFIGYWEVSGEQAAAAAKEYKRRQAEMGYLYGRNYLPHDIEVTEWAGDGSGNNQTRKQVLEGLGVTPIIVVPRITNELEGIDMVRRILHRCRFDVVNCGPKKAGAKARGGIDALRNFTKEFNEQTETFKDTPRKDWTNHGADAFRMFAQAYRPDSTVGVAPAETEQENWKVT